MGLEGQDFRISGLTHFLTGFRVTAFTGLQDYR
jgi:hypothetical protein